MKKRNTYYDKLKGLAIVLVVLGHAVQDTFPDTFDQHELFRLIYSFHMPLFMFLSGLVSYSSEKKLDLKWLGKRAASYLLPFFAWIIIPFFFSREWHNLPAFLKEVAKGPDRASWFLWILFLNCVLLFLIYKIKWIPAEITSIVFCVILYHLSKYFWYLGIGLLSWHCVFFLSGHFLAKHKDRFFRYRWIIGIVGTVGWLLLNPFWRRVEGPMFQDQLPALVGRFSGAVVRSYNYAVGFVGIAMVMLLVYLIRKLKVSVVLEYLGKRTIEIYLLQWFFFSIFTFQNPQLQVFVSFLTGLVIPYAISEIFERGWERKILFGKNKGIEQKNGQR